MASIKRELIGLMISVPSNIQYQLGDAVGVIADSDFWRRWDTLVDVSTDLSHLPPGSIDRIPGLGITADTGQCENEQRGTSGGTFDLQEMATLVSVGRAVYGD